MDELIRQRRDFLRSDPTYQARVQRVLDDAAKGILPPLVDWERLQKELCPDNLSTEGDIPLPISQQE